VKRESCGKEGDWAAKSQFDALCPDCGGEHPERTLQECYGTCWAACEKIEEVERLNKSLIEDCARQSRIIAGLVYQAGGEARLEERTMKLIPLRPVILVQNEPWTKDGGATTIRVMEDKP
jgi:hypothetical protein